MIANFIDGSGVISKYVGGSGVIFNYIDGSGVIANYIDGSGVLSLKSDDLSLSLGLTGALISSELLRLGLELLN